MFQDRFLRVIRCEETSYKRSWTLSNFLILWTTSRKFAYTDELAIAVQSATFWESRTNTQWQSGYTVALLPKLETETKPHKHWKLIFYLHQRMAVRKLEVYFNGSLLNVTQQYIGITLFSTLTCKHHLINTSAKVRIRNNIVQKLSGSNCI